MDAGFFVDKRDRQTRKVRWEQLDDALAYDAADLDRDVVAPDQIRTVLATFRDKVFTDMRIALRNLEEIMAERNLEVDHVTIWALDPMLCSRTVGVAGLSCARRTDPGVSTKPIFA